jgi:hypothetical protein
LKLDDEAASIRSCFVTYNFSFWSGPPPNLYMAYVQHLYMRRETDIDPPSDAYSIDAYLPNKAKVIELGKQNQSKSIVK